MTDHQKDRYAKLRYGFLNNITLFNNQQELEDFKKKKIIFLDPAYSSGEPTTHGQQFLDN
jgi:hypothetical protein